MGTLPEVPPAKKSSGKKKPRNRTAPSKRGEKKPAPSGSRLGAAQQAQRDSLMIARLAQNWTWPAIAAEAGISVDAAKKAVKARQENAPLALKEDPVKIVEDVMTGYQLSVGDLEAMASAALHDNNVAAAVGAKKAADDVREKILLLLQMTGRLPQELGALRHLIDIRAIAVRMLDTMDEFERRILEMDLNAKQRKEVSKNVLVVRSTFHELIGLQEEEERPPVPELAA